MRPSIPWLFCLLVIFGAAAANAAESNADKAVRYTEALEKHPLSADARMMRRWLLAWLTETRDYNVTICDILGPVSSDDAPYSAELVVQQAFGNVTYQIRHPGEGDPIARQVAGVESALRAYSALLAKNPKARIPYFDTLLAKQRTNTLTTFMAPIIRKGCSKRAEQGSLD